MKKGTNDSKILILKKSNNKGKRFEIIMKDHSHHFASDVGKTFIDHKDKKKNQHGFNAIRMIRIIIQNIQEYFIVKNYYGVNQH